MLNISSQVQEINFVVDDHDDDQYANNEFVNENNGILLRFC